MSIKIPAWVYGAALVAAIAFIVWVFVAAGSYNTWSAKTCEEAGLTWVKEYPYGGYGCADVIPFDQVGEKR